MHNQWQDTILAIGSLIFSIALIPSLISRHKPALITSLSTGLVLLVFSATYVSLSLWYAAGSSGLNAMLWLALAAQKAHQNRTVDQKPNIKP